MRKRVMKKAERMQLVDKVCELQCQICEYERYINDLAIMLAKEEIQTVRKHNIPYPTDWIWNKVKSLILEKKKA